VILSATEPPPFVPDDGSDPSSDIPTTADLGMVNIGETPAEPEAFRPDGSIAVPTSPWDFLNFLSPRGTAFAPSSPSLLPLDPFASSQPAPATAGVRWPLVLGVAAAVAGVGAALVFGSRP
jgi:hypothetical protein